jgi:transposase
MGQDSAAFVAFDTSKSRHAVAIAEGDRDGEVRYLGEIDNSDGAVVGLLKKIVAKHSRVTFCYEAGPTGYGLYRLISSLGHECLVVAPSLIPLRAGDRVKTNRRDALNLVKLLRAGELTRVWVPDERHEAIRDLTRARQTAVVDLSRKQQQILSLMLRLGRSYSGKRNWTRAHMKWLASQKLDHLEQRLVLEEMLLALRQAQERIARLEEAICEAVPGWSLVRLVYALMALRGVDFISATGFLAEIGDLSRFRTARELMSFLGLVASERSTGNTIIRGSITKAGNRRARRILVECAWSYRHPARIGPDKLGKIMSVPPLVQEIAWKAQCRLTARFRALLRRGKLKTVAVTAIARELSGFIWAIARAVAEPVNLQVA